jgi:predicted transcriptional regulator
MAEHPPEPTDAELAVLQVLWDRGPSTIRLLTDILYPKGAGAPYATVQKLLERLEDKGHVSRDRGAHAHVFAARTSRDDLVGRRLRDMAESLCGGLMTPLLIHLVRAQTLTDRERRELRDLIDDLDRKSAGRRAGVQVPDTNR